jgi:hypothetical protein
MNPIHVLFLNVHFSIISHLRLNHASGLFPSSFPAKILNSHAQDRDQRRALCENDNEPSGSIKREEFLTN